MQKNNKQSHLKHIKDLWHIICSDKNIYKKSFNEYQTVRRKYILSQVSKRLEKDCMEPAPLLGMKLLDIGCGNCEMAKEMVFRGAEVTAIDINEKTIKTAKQKSEKSGAPMEFINSSPESLVISGQTFDILLCLDVISYVEDKNKFAWALKKLLNKNGVIIFSEQHHSIWSYIWHIIIAEKIAKWVKKGTFSDDKNTTQKEFLSSLEKSGFNIISTQDISFNLKRKKWVKSSQTAIRYMGIAEKK